MRRERQPSNEDAETTAYTFNFQIKNNGGRQACRVKVQALNIHDATTFFRQNWPTIESMARDGLLNKSGDAPTIKLATPGNQSKRIVATSQRPTCSSTLPLTDEALPGQ
jgi:hypothetical protein